MLGLWLQGKTHTAKYKRAVMISLGIDAVEIERFKAWLSYNPAKLSRIFSALELDYCFATPTKTAERLAVRFAAKEAFYKAVSPILKQPLPLLHILKHCEMIKDKKGLPSLRVQWAALGLEPYESTLSVTHTNTTALAVVILLKF